MPKNVDFLFGDTAIPTKLYVDGKAENFKGAYNIALAYSKNAMVISGDQLYVATQDIIAGAAPFGSGGGGWTRIGYVSEATSTNPGAITAANFSALALQTTRPFVRAYNSANQAIANLTVVPLALNTERADTHGFHDTATNNTRLTIPTGLGGTYLIGGTLAWEGRAGALRNVLIRLNGTLNIAPLAWEAGPTATNDQMAIVTVYSLAAGDYVELCAYHSSGSALSVIAVGGQSPEFWAIRQGG